MYKLDWQWPGVVTFSVVFLALAVLVGLGKVPADLLVALLAWLVPSPMRERPRPPPLPPEPVTTTEVQ